MNNNRNKQKLIILEQALVQFGRTVTYEQLKELLSEYKNINDKIYKLIKEGWIVKLRRGLYYISKLGSLGFTSVSNYKIANLIGEESFVSFEAALKFHGLFDQSIKRYRSISTKQYLLKKLEGVQYKYIKVRSKNYFGWNEEDVDGGIARIAFKERALIDLLEYQRTINSVSLVLEKLQYSYDEFNQDWFFKYLGKYSKVTIKTFGILLDLINKDSSNVYLLLDKSNTSTSYMFSSSETFNSKWRIYYDSILEEQVK